MGEAFSSVKLGPNCAYFPAVSLSVTENLRANFGSTPLRYPFNWVFFSSIYQCVCGGKLCGS